MTECVSPVIEVVKLVCPTIWKYIKFQVTPNSYVKECGNGKGRLQNRLHEIERELQSQSMAGIGKIPKQQVEDWLKRANDAITDEDEFNKGGCFCNICRAKHFYDRTRELKSIHDEGATYTQAGVILVQDDHAIIKDHLMGEFKKTYESLRHRKMDIDSTLREQLRFGKKVREEVIDWLESVDKELKTKQDEVSQAGCLSPLLLVELVNRKIRALKELLENGMRYTDVDAALVNVDCSTSKGDPLYAEKNYGRDTVLADILKHLKGDQVARIAVWGMGGIGKSTLMRQIYNQFLNEARFDKAIWVTVTSTLDIFQIQNEIAKQVDGKPLEEKDANKRAGKISALLRSGSYLLILDDVWEACSDKDVGIPAESEGLKLVVTTRAADVARKMDCDEILKLQPLTPEEALRLFLDKVGKAVLSADGNIKPGLKAALMEIVKECDGLPLAVATVASTMKGMSNDRYSWVKALKQLRKGTSVVEGDKDPIRILQFSYDHLKNERIQHCFLYCALFPEDWEIPKERLIEYWIEEGLIDQMDTRGEMICEGHNILQKLQDSCLLECTIRNLFVSDLRLHHMLGLNEDIDERVKMHDLLRDMALDIASKSPRLFVKAGVSKEELRKEEALPADVEKVSLMENKYMEEFPLVVTHLKYTMLTTLLMPRTGVVTIPESLFIQTPSLRILDLSWNMELRSLPDSISELENLTTLLLGHCYNLKRVPSLSKCQALTKLDLKNSGIKELPDGTELLVNLKYLNLRWTQIELPAGLLPKLSNLQHLLVEDKEMRVEDVIMLRKLEYLEADLGGRLDETSILLGFMQEQAERLTSYTLQVAEPSLTLLLRGNLRSITARLVDDGKCICELSIPLGFMQDKNSDVICVNHILVNQTSSLRLLTILDSKNIECVFGLGFNPLQTLESLSLGNLQNLKSVFDEKALGSWPPPSSSHSFYPLKSITIKRCGKLKRIFSPALLRGYLQNLEHISIFHCSEIEEIIISFKSEEEEAQERLTLPKLKTLKLKDLPKLKSICGSSSSSSVLICDSLEVLEIEECEELNRIPQYLPQLNNAQPSSTEWGHHKGMLLPFSEFRQRLFEEAPGVLRAVEALLKLIGKTPSDHGPIAQSKRRSMNLRRGFVDSLTDTNSKESTIDKSTRS